MFYQYNPSPVFFNKQETERLKSSQYAQPYQIAEIKHQNLTAQRQRIVADMQAALQAHDEAAQEAAVVNLHQTDEALKTVKQDVVKLIQKNNPAADTNDVNYIFLRFVLDFLPHGLIGLLIAVIFSASMGSIAAAYSSLASTTVVDVYKRLVRNDGDDAHYLSVSRWATVGWGIFCIIVAQFANQLGSMIEAVNILGSLFYGVILGVFVVAFYVKSIGGRATFWGALIAEVFVVLSWYLNLTAFLWLNVIGCLLVVGFAWLLQQVFRNN